MLRSVGRWFALAIVIGFSSGVALADCEECKAVRAESVSDWRNPIHYPTLVAAIQWNEQRLDANTSVRFGSWTVWFGAPTHVASYVQFGAADAGFIYIMGERVVGKSVTGHGDRLRGKSLRCINAAAGESTCSLDFDLRVGGACQMNIWYVSGSTHYPDKDQHLRIPCPQALEFVR